MPLLMVPNIQGQREQGKETEETALEFLTYELVFPASGSIWFTVPL